MSKLENLLAHASSVLSTQSGLDAGLHLMQYSSPLVAAALLKLVQKRAEAGVKSPELINISTGIVRAGTSLGEARTIMRAFGLVPMLDWLLKLHPRPLEALLSVVRRPLQALNLADARVFSTYRVLLLIVFYVGEHVAWLGNKGVLPLAPETIGRVAQVSIRSWAVDVFLTVGKLLAQYAALRSRQGELRRLRATGGADKEKLAEKSAALRHELKTWQTQAAVSFGWLPLTVQWASGGALWDNPLITGVIGLYVGCAKMNAVWNK